MQKTPHVYFLSECVGSRIVESGIYDAVAVKLGLCSVEAVFRL